MAAKPSVLEAHGTMIRRLLNQGKSLAEIAAALDTQKGLKVSRQAVGLFTEKKGWCKADTRPEAAPPLFLSWLAVGAAAGKTQEELLDELNAACGTHYKMPFISNLRSGEKGLERSPAVVRNYMLEAVLSARLLAQGITEQVVRDLVESVAI